LSVTGGNVDSIAERLAESAVAERLVMLEAESASRLESLRAAEVELQRRKATVEALEGRLDQSNRSLAETRDRVVELESLRDRARSEIRAIEQDRATLSDELRALARDRETLNGEIRALVGDRASLHEAIRNRERDLEERETRIRGLEAERTSLAETVRVHQIREEELEARVRVLERDRAVLIEVIRSHERDHAALDARGRSLEAERTALAHELEAERADRAAQIERLASEVAVHRAWAGLPLWKRVACRLSGRVPGGTPQPVAIDLSPRAVVRSMGDALRAAGIAPESMQKTLMELLSTDRALGRFAARGGRVGTVIDVGASNGMWSDVCMRHFPEARYALIEAQETHRAALERFVERRPNASIVLKAAGSRLGQIWFDERFPFGGLASERQLDGMHRQLPVTTIDHEVASAGLPGPYLVKMDTHGFELPILEGAAETLKHASLVVIECYALRLRDGSPIFDEVVTRMRELGFGVIDLTEPLWRPLDGCLWQFDLLFRPLSSPEFAACRYE
jgi:FkbM family methyltransferase